MSVGYELVIVGTSWGGLDALRTMVGALPAEFGLAVIIVQHRHRESGTLLRGFLQDITPLPVTEVEDKMPIEAGAVYVAPPDYHTLVECGSFSLSCDEPVRYSRPSIDVAMLSAADAYTFRAVGVVLTGANADGAAGLRRIVDRGGLAVIQKPSEAESPVMPEAALVSVPSARVFGLLKAARFISSLPVYSPPKDGAA
ncbi:MAG: cheB, two-component system, chemotaxis family, response regulator CheB [Gemmatimonadetes bacterium]|nr:cheB, two-component system, chemotaxis family, response regulator CheB [Gemmatimonadota bacterium]